MAYLLGSDYTDGVNGVGVVNSSEIISAFMEPPKNVESDASEMMSSELFATVSEESGRILQSLQRFKKWLDNYAVDAIIEEMENKKDRLKTTRKSKKSYEETSTKRRRVEKVVHNDTPGEMSDSAVGPNSPFSEDIENADHDLISVMVNKLFGILLCAVKCIYFPAGV